MDSDSDFPQETDSSGEGEDDDLSHLGAAQTMVKSFVVKQESYQMVKRGLERQRLADTVLRSCQPAAGAIVPTSGFPRSDEIQQLVPGSSTDIIQQNFLQVQQQFGDVTVEGARNLTIGGTQNIGKPGQSQEEVKQLTWTKKIWERTKSRIEEWTHGMVKTSALAKVMTKLTKGATWISIKGSPGEGKTTTASDMGRISDYFTHDEHVVYMSHTGERDIQEKLAIWKVISEASRIELDEKTIDTICKISVPHGFPHVCRLFVTMRKEDSNINAESFFKAPLEFLNQTVQKFMKDKVKLTLFKEMIKRNGSVSIRDLGNVDNSAEIIDIANNLVGTYLSKEDGNFTFNHPSIYDSVAFNLCKNFPLFVIENCHLSFLQERLRLDQSHDTGHESSLVVNIPRCFIVDLAKRFAAEIENRNLRLVLSHKALTDQLFIEELMCCVKIPLNELLTLTDKQRDEDVLAQERYPSFLSLVASNKSPQLLKYIDNETDIQLTERDINTVLYGVCKYAASDVLTYIVQSRDTLDINVRYEYDKTPLMIASETRDSQFVQQIMSLGPFLKARESRLPGRTVLHHLCSYGHVIAVEEVIDRVGGVDVKDGYGWSPLFYACLYNQVDVARVLIDRGARVDAETVVDACSEGNLDVVKLLWERGATVNMTTYRDTSLTAASEGGHVKVMRFLIDKGASVNTADGLGQSPLHCACIYNKPQAVQCLLEHGAYIDSRSLDLAVRKGYQECIDMLQK